MNWNSEELSALLEKRYKNEEDFEHFRRQLQSVHRKIYISKYHTDAALNAFSGVAGMEENVEGPGSALKVILGSSPADQSDILQARLVAEANTLALAYNMHSLSGIIASLMHSALSLSNEIDKKIKVITRHIEDSELKEKIIKLIGTKEFCYLDALVNNSKHENLASSVYSVDFANDAHGMKYVEFTYKNRPHKEKWYGDFFKDLDSLLKLYIDILSSLNEYIERRV